VLPQVTFEKDIVEERLVRVIFLDRHGVIIFLHGHGFFTIVVVAYVHTLSYTEVSRCQSDDPTKSLASVVCSLGVRVSPPPRATL